jgi:rhodanese-related sulfurtransferase
MDLSENQRRYIFGIAILLVISVLAYTQLQSENKPLFEYSDVTVEQAKQLIEERPKLVILDVRTVSEYEDGHIEGAILIPVQEIENRLDELSTKDEILVYCRTGNRSSTAIDIMLADGFTKIYHMNRGITAWIDAGYPVVSTT